MSRPYLVGLDLGQANDYTAVAVCEVIPGLHGQRDATLHVKHLERMLHVPYPEQVARVGQLLDSPILRHRADLIIDATGVGRPVVDMFRQAGRMFKGVTITAGDAESRGDDGLYRVPKRNLVGALQVLLQSGRLKIAEGLELAETLKAELLNFKVKINLKTSHDSYEAWRENEHDDLCLAVCMCAWGLGRQPVIPTGPMGVVKPEGSFWLNSGT